MTIVSVRIYCYLEDEGPNLKLSRTYGGFAEWFERRLKPIRDQLRGPEAKGVNIVNFMLFENPEYASRLNHWERRDNTFNYDCLYDLRSLLAYPPIQNIEHLMHFTAEIAAKALWPQVLAVGRALEAPLTDEDRTSMLPYLRWPREKV
jgi:hypothetical protein